MRSFVEALEGRRLFAGNLLVNGSFEKPQIGGGTSGQGYSDYAAGQVVGAGWKVTSGSVDIVGSTPGYTYSTTPANGHQCLDLNGFQPGTISQSVTTVVGHRYLLRFAYTATPFAGTPTLRSMSVQFEGRTITTLSKNETGETPTKPGWTYVQYLVTATSTSSAVTFIAKSAGSLGIALDDVSLVEQPCGTASIAGQVFADGNGDGQKGTDAIGLSGWSVYLDLNGNGVLDSSDLVTTTDHFGNFSFTGLAAGTYKVRIAQQSGWKLTTPSLLTVTLASGQKMTNRLFGEQPI